MIRSLRDDLPVAVDLDELQRIGPRAADLLDPADQMSGMRIAIGHRPHLVPCRHGATPRLWPFGRERAWIEREVPRIVARHDSNAASLFYSALVGCLGLSLAMPFIWQAPSWDQWLLLAALGFTGGLAHTLVIRAFSFASASIVAPFIYLQLLWAIVIGFFWFGNWPVLTTWIGAAIIIATGLYTAHRERVRARQKALSPKG